MSTEKARWFGFGLPALVLAGLGIALGLHLGLSRPWGELALPIVAYVGLQVATYVCMFWARNRGRTRGDYRPAIALVGLYGWGVGLLVIHYGKKWGFLGHQKSNDLVPFSVFMLVIVAVTVALFSLFKRELHSTK